MFDDDDDDNPIGILILGVLAAVLSIIIWQFIQDDDGGVAQKYGTTAVAEVAAAPEPTAAPEATAVPEPTAVPEADPEPAAPAVVFEPLVVAGTLVGGGTGLILEGRLPDEESRTALVSAAYAEYGQENVEDRTTLDEGVAWEAGMNITLDGEANSPEAADKLRRFIVLEGATVVDNIVVVEPEPTPEPVNLEQSLNDLFLLEPIQFDSGSARIRAESDATIDAAAELLIANPDGALVVEGHTDSKGSRGANQTLSDRRAEAVLNALVDRGVNADRLTSQGFGEDEPVADNATLDGRQQNRRIEFSLG